MSAITPAPAPQATRVILFLTAAAAADIPAAPGTPACLLPLGAYSFAERVLDSCSRAGLTEVDLVVSDQPERLRQRLRDGWRWGLTVRWHLAKESATPYGIVHALGIAPDDAVLVGHGHQWLSSRVLKAVLDAGPMATAVDGQGAWLGWVRLEGVYLQALSAHSDYDALRALAASLPEVCRCEAGRSEHAGADAAAALLQAQDIALQDGSGIHVPASWQRHPWGAMSPEATVHPQARIEGPVLIGPRCMVERDARLGPGVVLTRDVIISAGAELREAVVLPDTYVGGAVTLDRAIVRANTVQDLRWQARVDLPAREGLLTPLSGPRRSRPGWVARLLALCLALVCAPVALVAGFWAAAQGRRAWIERRVVRGRDVVQGGLVEGLVRESRPGTRGAETLLGRYGGLLDVVQGRRSWFGMRPRDEAQWYALRRDWQLLFSDQPIGLFHAPAWIELDGQPDSEATAAADAYFLVSAGWRERWRTLRLHLRGMA